MHRKSAVAPVGLRFQNRSTSRSKVMMYSYASKAGNVETLVSIMDQIVNVVHTEGCHLHPIVGKPEIVKLVASGTR